MVEDQIYATVEWTDAKGTWHKDGVRGPTCVTTVLDGIAAKGGKVSKYHRILKAG